MADMNELVRVFRGVIGDQMETYGLTDYRVGEVTKASPLEIKISDRIYLKENKLVLTEAVLQKQLDLSHLHQVQGDTKSAGGPDMHSHRIDVDSQKNLTKLITITEGLKVGDKVHLISVARGQQFIVLGKIREQKSVVIDKENNWKWS